MPHPARQPTGVPTAGADRAVLPAGIRGLLLDMDGVLTATAAVHATAWKAMFDAFLAARPPAAGEVHRPFDDGADYTAHVDGRLRVDGVRTFLGSRGIVLPEGDPADGPERETLHGLGARKNALVLELIAAGQSEAFPDARRFLARAAAAGMPAVVVSSSRNAAAVLAAAGMESGFAGRIDGTVAAERGLPGKPAPDMFLAGAALMGLAPEACVVVEDAEAGVAAGAAGPFGWVVGVDREGDPERLRRAGADAVIPDLDHLEFPA
ncbi:MAG: beta-phosphoglucomutase family hydrolase [Miltoncostaeaceae bacterium]